ncbi:MAG: ABC transporter ATP-binding protein [Eubacteriales bacterium]
MKEKKSSEFNMLFEFIKPCRNKQVQAILFATMSVLGAIVPYYCAYQLFDLFFTNQQNREDILFWSGVALMGFLVKAVGHAISTTIAHESAYSILENIRNYIADKLMNAPLGVTQNKSIGKLKNLIVDHVETIELPLAHVIPEGFAAIVQPTVVFIYMCVLDYRLALASMITLPLGFLPFLGCYKSYDKNYKEYMNANDMMNSTIVEYVEGIEVVKAFNQTSTSYEKFTNSIHNFKETTMNWFRTTWVAVSIMKVVLPTTTMGVLPLGIYLYLNEGLEPSKILLSILLSMGMVGNLNKLSGFFNNIKVIQYSMQTVTDLIEEEELSQGSRDEEIVSYNITLENVDFAYDDTKKVLKQINITFESEKFYALVGPSGSGKSTIAKLIARFWDVTSGSIQIGGINIQEISLHKLSSIVSFVTQDNFLFNTTIFENIKVGNPNATDEQVYDASKRAMCHDFIMGLEKGYDSDAGSAGKKLSGGEKQRIAIARAILKDAPIVILDEATAFTDPENELEIQKSIMELTKGKTLIVIAHRLSTIKNADTILLINNGELEEMGTHKELLEQSDLYKNMWELHINAKRLEGENV